MISRPASSFAGHRTERSIELLVVSDLVALWSKKGRRHQARDLLAPVYGWFTEDFDTPDLKEAKALLGELAGI